MKAKAKMTASRRATATRRSQANARVTGKQVVDAINQLRMSELAQLQASSTIERQRSETFHRGASQTLRSMASWTPRLGSGRNDTPKAERDRLAARSYDAWRNHNVARAITGRFRTNVVGTGLQYHSAVDADVLGISEDQAHELNTIINAEFGLYYNNPMEVDIEATLDGPGLQALGFLSAMLGGDCFALTPFKERPGCIYGTKIQLIDGARVCNQNDLPDTPTLQDGVEITRDGEPIAIHIRRRHPGERITMAAIDADQWDRREIFGLETGQRRIFQLWQDKDRIGTTRGVPLLAPILEPLQQLEQYTRAELMAAVVSAMFTVFIKKEVNQTDARGEPIPIVYGNTAKGEAAGLALGFGAVMDMAPGETAEFADPSRPSSKFDPFFLAMVKCMSAALELPVDEVLLAYTDSYSAARAAMLQAWRVYEMRRWWLVQQFCQPHFALWFDEAVARGRISVTDYADPRRRAAYQTGIWQGPARGAMDETQEANASKMRIDAGISNETIEASRSMGEPWINIYRQRLRELKRRKADGAELGPAPGQAAGPGTDPAADPNDRRKPPPGTREPPADEDAEEETESEAEGV